MLEVPSKERFLRLMDVKRRTGLSRSTIYLDMSKGNFPKSVSLGARSVGWLESEIDIWMQSRIEKIPYQIHKIKNSLDVTQCDGML
mgnify:CR=1 FL=1